jgi:hypothetical protein
MAFSTNAGAQMLQWSTAQKYDKGVQSAVAVHPSGLAMEVHQTHVSGGVTLWYHFGMLGATDVTWEGSHRLPFDGNWPNVAITPEGYVIVFYSGGNFKSDSYLYYAVGLIDPFGSANQSITWLTPKPVLFDRGFHSAMAINESGVILDVHESGTGGKGLYYRVGHLTDPASGDYSITWDSGDGGVKYDDGINPHIALNNHNEVVEVHQVTGETYMHYRRGTVSGGTVRFGGSPRYDNNASEAAVVLLDDGHVVELHRNDGVASARTGVLDTDNPERVEWSESMKISDAASDSTRYPSLATNGTYAIGSWTSYSFDISGQLFSSVALLVAQDVFESEWEFPVRVSRRRTHRRTN